MAIAFDIGNPEALAHELAEANRDLAREREAPIAVARLVDGVADSILEADDSSEANVDRALWKALTMAARRAQAFAREEDVEDRRRELRVSIEQLRFLLARLAERTPVGAERPVGEVIQWLEQVGLGPSSLSTEQKGELLGVGQGVYESWLDERDTPSGEAEQRVRAAARAINELRRSVDPDAAFSWFFRARGDLNDGTPHQALMRDRLEDVVAAAVSTRSSSAT